MIQLESEVDPLKRLSLQDISYSRLNTFNNCQLQYYFQYVVRVPQDYGHPAKLGNIIHEALEHTLEHEGAINKHELILNYHKARSEYDPNYEISDTMINDGQEMLIVFADKMNSEAVPSGIDEEDYLFVKEMPFSFIVGRARINGYIDYVSVRDSLVFIRDYKSGKQEVAQKNVATNLQLGIYSLYLKYLYPDKTIHSELYYLRSDKQKGHVYTTEELETVEKELIQSIDKVLDTEDFKATTNEWNCTYCSYAKDGTCPTGQFRLRRKGVLPWPDQT